jgi:aldehyde:ferredoxin oxidoreductase
MDHSGVNSSMVYCQFLAGAVNMEYTICLLKAVTGEDFTSDELQQIGARTWYLRRLFNLDAGMGLEGDSLPKRIIDHIEKSSASLKDFSKALLTYHQLRGLDENGVPAKEKLQELGLDEYVDQYYGEENE